MPITGDGGTHKRNLTASCCQRCCLYLDILQNEVKRFQSTMGKLCRSPVCAVLGRTVTSRRSLKVTHRLQNAGIHTS